MSDLFQEQNRTFTIQGFWEKGYSLLECSSAVALSHRCTRLEHFKPIWWAMAWIEDTAEANKDNSPFYCLLYLKKVDAGTCAICILLCNVWGRHPLQRSFHGFSLIGDDVLSYILFVFLRILFNVVVDTRSALWIIQVIVNSNYAVDSKSQGKLKLSRILSRIYITPNPNAPLILSGWQIFVLMHQGLQWNTWTEITSI